MKRNQLLSLTMVVAVVAFTGCGQSSKNKEMVKQELFGTNQGKEVFLLTLTNKAGNVLKITNFGAKINWIEVPDKNGNKPYDNMLFFIKLIFNGSFITF